MQGNAEPMYTIQQQRWAAAPELSSTASVTQTGVDGPRAKYSSSSERWLGAGSPGRRGQVLLRLCIMLEATLNGTGPFWLQLPLHQHGIGWGGWGGWGAAFWDCLGGRAPAAGLGMLSGTAWACAWVPGWAGGWALGRYGT